MTTFLTACGAVLLFGGVPALILLILAPFMGPRGGGE